MRDPLLDEANRSVLFYALLMKDLGCSSNAARFAALFGASDHDLKSDLQHINWSRALESFRFVVRNAAPGQPLLSRVWRLLAVLSRGPEGAREVVRTRCERGADIARQTVEIFYSTYGVVTAYDMALARRGRWFDPNLVDALMAFRSDTDFWRRLAAPGHADTLLRSMEPADRVAVANEADIDRVAEAFANVIDAKSPWTYQHSSGVAETAVAIGRLLEYGSDNLRELRRAALLHDLGKLGVSNLILDKPGKLTNEEFTVMRRHPEHTSQILSRVPCFQPFADRAAAHHERLDGKGYHRGLAERDLSRDARILCVADVFDALRSSRPYRAGLPVERILEIMGKDVGIALDPQCVDALRVVIDQSQGHTVPDVPAARLVPALAEDYFQAA